MMQNNNLGFWAGFGQYLRTLFVSRGTIYTIMLLGITGVVGMVIWYALDRHSNAKLAAESAQAQMAAMQAQMAAMQAQLNGSPRS